MSNIIMEIGAWNGIQIHFRNTQEMTMFVKMCSKYYLYNSWICEL